MERTPGVFEEVGHGAEYQGCGGEVTWSPGRNHWAIEVCVRYEATGGLGIRRRYIVTEIFTGPISV